MWPVLRPGRPPGELQRDTRVRCYLCLKGGCQGCYGSIRFTGLAPTETSLAPNVSSAHVERAFPGIWLTFFLPTSTAVIILGDFSFRVDGHQYLSRLTSNVLFHPLHVPRVSSRRDTFLTLSSLIRELPSQSRSKQPTLTAPPVLPAHLLWFSQESFRLMGVSRPLMLPFSLSARPLCPHLPFSAP